VLQGRELFVFRLLKTRLLGKFLIFSNVRPEDRDQLHERLIREIQIANCFIDIGANEGEVTKFALKENARSNFRVIAFEPDPIAFSRLSLIADRRLQLVEAAVWTQNGIKRLFRHRDFQKNYSTTSSTLISSKSNVTAEHCVLVRTLDIVDLVRDAGDNSLVIKIDAEGAEYAILFRLIRKRLIKKAKIIFCEFHPLKIRFGILMHSLLHLLFMLSRNKSRISNWY
jgi:FkbM family methyltransferase